MKHSLLLSLAFAFGASFANATTFTISTSGFTFAPSSITVTDQDTIQFVVGGGHNATEVSQTTWNANGTTVLAGGFAYQSGTNILTGLTAGTRYYVCTPHVGLGMKGQITITSTVGISNNTANKNLLLFPNPIKDKFTVNLKGNETSIKIYDVLGKTIAEYSNLNNGVMEIDALQNVTSGTYFLIVNTEKEIFKYSIIKE
jgi:plastocyanin